MSLNYMWETFTICEGEQLNLVHNVGAVLLFYCECLWQLHHFCTTWTTAVHPQHLPSTTAYDTLPCLVLPSPRFNAAAVCCTCTVFSFVWCLDCGHCFCCMCPMCRAGQNHVHTAYTQYFWQGNHQIYGHIRCIYTILANPSHLPHVHLWSPGCGHCFYAQYNIAKNVTRIRSCLTT
jgi:hypothetical protein